MVNNKSGWTFFSNHAHVYFILATGQSTVLREVAGKVGITERAVQAIIRDLEEAGYIQRERSGRTNEYKIIPGTNLRHPLEKNVQVSDLTALIVQAHKD